MKKIIAFSMIACTLITAHNVCAKPQQHNAYLDNSGSNMWRVTNNTSNTITFYNADHSQKVSIAPNDSADIKRGNSFHFSCTAEGRRLYKGKTQEHNIYVDTEVQGNLMFTTK